GGKARGLGGAGREMARARLERLPALVRAGEPDGVEGVGLAVVLGEIGLGDDEPQRLLRRRAVAEPQGGRLRERRICCCQQEQAEDDYSTNAAARSAVLRASERFTHVVLPCGEQSRSCPPHFGR